MEEAIRRTCCKTGAGEESVESPYLCGCAVLKGVTKSLHGVRTAVSKFSTLPAFRPRMRDCLESRKMRSQAPREDRVRLDLFLRQRFSSCCRVVHNSRTKLCPWHVSSSFGWCQLMSLWNHLCFISTAALRRSRPCALKLKHINITWIN